MNLEEFGSNDVAISTEASSVDSFLSHYKKKVTDHASIFEHSYVQKILPDTQVNYQDFETSKYLEFLCNDTQHMSQMSSLSAHITVQLQEIMTDGTYKDLANGDTARIGVIPGVIQVFNVEKWFISDFPN